jgi:adenylate cyclase
VPVSGGKAIALRKQRVYLGRKPDADPQAPLSADTALCRLLHDSGWWHAEDLACPQGLRVNGATVTSARLKPQDEIAIGRTRLRISYDAPLEDLESVAEDVLKVDVHPPAPPPAPIAPESYKRPEPDPAGYVLGRLLPLGGGPDFPLTKARVTIGRKSDCDIVLRYSTVSSMHCGLEFVDGYWRVLDLGSRNGIRVDGERCQSAWLHPRARLSIAEHRFQIDYIPEGPPPEPDMNDPSMRKSLMEKVGVTQQTWDKTLSRHEAENPDEDAPKRYDLLGEM